MPTRTTNWGTFPIMGINGTKRLRPMTVPPRDIRGHATNTIDRLNARLHGSKIDEANARKGGTTKVSTPIGTAFAVCRELPDGTTIPIIGQIKCCKCPPGEKLPNCQVVHQQAVSGKSRDITPLGVVIRRELDGNNLTHDPKTHLRYSSADLFPTRPKKLQSHDLTPAEYAEWNLKRLHYETVEKAGELIEEMVRAHTGM